MKTLRKNVGAPYENFFAKKLRKVPYQKLLKITDYA
jgi:hypothetical protein